MYNINGLIHIRWSLIDFKIFMHAQLDKHVRMKRCGSREVPYMIQHFRITKPNKWENIARATWQNKNYNLCILTFAFLQAWCKPWSCLHMKFDIWFFNMSDVSHNFLLEVWVMGPISPKCTWLGNSWFAYWTAYIIFYYSSFRRWDLFSGWICWSPSKRSCDFQYIYLVTEVLIELWY